MFKFTVDPVNVERLKATIEKEFKTVAKDPAMLQDVGKAIVERIRYQGQITKPINDGGGFPALKASTTSHRAALAKYNPVDRTYDKARSNLTLTGAFWRSLGFDVTGEGEITAAFKGEHPGYKLKKGRTENNPTNEALAGYLRLKGFQPFTVQALNTFKPITTRVTSIVRAYLRRSLKLS